MNVSQRASIQQRLARLCRVSAVISHVSLFIAIGWPLLAIGYMSTASLQEIAAQMHLALPSGLAADTALDTWQRVLLTLLVLLPTLLGSLGLLGLRRAFMQFARERFFDIEVVSAMRRFAGYITCGIALDWVDDMLSVVVMSWNFGPGKRMFAIGISSEQILYLFFAAVVWVFAGVMLEARRLAEENAEFV